MSYYDQNRGIGPMGEIQPTSTRPTNISQRPNPDGTIYVETAMPPPLTTSDSNGSNPSHPSQGQSLSHPDLAGVLRRNQACLNCRRRKLKCDATRPHCGTCIRSYRHALRTSPKSNPVMACEYDDESGHAPASASTSTGGMGISNGSGTSLNALMDDEDTNLEGEKKRKRKPNGSGNGNGNGRKKSDDDEQSRTNLVKRIQELEAQIQAKNTGNDGRTTSPHLPQGYQTTSAPSPTALLDLLSSTASAQASAAHSGGFRDGATESIMMMSGSTGLTPFLQVDDPMASNPGSKLHPPRHQDSGSTSASESSRQTSDNPTSSGPSILSPYHLFDTSPSSGPDTNSNYSKAGTNVWSTMGNPTLGLQPSTRVDGPWRGVETTETIFATTGAKIDNDGIPLEQMPMYPQRQSADASGFMNDPTNIIGADGFIMDEAAQQRLLLDLFWPGWPPKLPEPNIVNDLIESFFSLVPNLPRMMHRPRLLARMALPPTHQNFPHPALLHAICSCASLWCAPAVYAQSTTVNDNPFLRPSSEKWGKPTITLPTNMSFSAQQAELAKELIQEGLTTGHKLLDVVRATIIISRVFIDETRMLECWTYTGLATRMILPLGMNVRSAELSLKSVMLPPPVDALEREERRATVWMAFHHDTIGSAASGWGSSMSIDELTVPLPSSTVDFQAGSEFMETNPQDIESLDLWTNHPVADAFVLCMKATILLNRVNRFVRKWKNRRLREDDDLEGMQRPEFRELANAISCLQMSFPSHMRNPLRVGPNGKREIELIAAHLLPHMATICLYEPFSDVTDPTDPATRRLASASTGIVSIVQEIAVGSGGQADFSTVMHSSASVALTTAARTSVVFYRQALNIGDLAQAETHRMDIEVVRMALAQFGTRFKIGYHHAQLIEYFLDRSTNPSFEKLAAHYPEHPRPGAPDLYPGCDLGRCIINALNIKRGYWRLPKQAPPAGISPFESTPESTGTGTGTGTGQASGTGSASGGSNTVGGGYGRYTSTSTSTTGTGTGGNANGKGVANALGKVTEECPMTNTAPTSTADTFPHQVNTFPFYPQEQGPAVYQNGKQIPPDDIHLPFVSVREKERAATGSNYSSF